MILYGVCVDKNQLNFPIILFTQHIKNIEAVAQNSSVEKTVLNNLTQGRVPSIVRKMEIEDSAILQQFLRAAPSESFTSSLFAKQVIIKQKK